jgi:hypothetical protein
MQSKKGSMLETSMNIGSGFILSMITWQIIANPLFGYDVSWDDNLMLTSIFTTISLIRSYAWRRIFNWRAKQCG